MEILAPLRVMRAQRRETNGSRTDARLVPRAVSGGLSRIFRDLLLPERTTQEVAFLEKALALLPGSRILGLYAPLLVEAQRMAQVAGIQLPTLYHPRLAQRAQWARTGAEGGSSKSR